MTEKRVYTFGNGKAEGKADMRNLLGGKGANLAEMNLIGVPVPPGFTITTDVCNEYFEKGKDAVVALLKDDVAASVHHVEELMNCKFGDVANPLLVSVRSGARASMPGMMDTILNLGLNDEVVEGLAKKTGNERFAYDSYRRFVQMYGDVVLGMKPVNKEDIDPFEAIIQKVKAVRGIKLDNEMSVDELKQLVTLFKEAIKSQTGKDFPNDPMEQLWGAICAVFDSWMNERAILYRKMEGIPAEWGTAVTVMAMVFGNMGPTSATGVCFSRDAATGENSFNGETFSGSGDLNYRGGGLAVRYRLASDFYVEGSVRAGELKTEMDRAVRASSGELLGYSLRSFYWGAHAGLGQILENDASTLDLYGRIYHTEVDGENFNLGGDRFVFGDVKSTRTRIGAKIRSKAWGIYAGAAAEYEFDGDAKMTAADLDAPTESLKGLSMMGEVGWSWAPDTSPWALDVRVGGWGGARRGVVGQAYCAYRF